MSLLTEITRRCRKSEIGVCARVSLCVCAPAFHLAEIDSALLALVKHYSPH